MALSKYERKEKLPYGAQSEIATELGLSESTVSLVMNDKAADRDITPETIAKVQSAVAQRIGLPVSDVWEVPAQADSTSEVEV